MKVVIVGGVAGGATAAARIRRLDEQAEIVVFERSGYISYANCGLPYFIGGVIEDPAELTLQTPEGFFKRFRISMKVHHEVLAIHPDRKTVSVKNLETGDVFEERYDKLHNMCIKYEARTLDFTPTCSLELLKEQKGAMGNYLRILEIRAEIEGVKL